MTTWTNTGPLRTLSVVICALLAVFSCKANDNTAHAKHNKIAPSFLRGEQQGHRELQRPEYPCILVRVETEYEPIDVDGRELFSDFIPDEVRCELSDDDVEKAGGQYFVALVGMESSQFDFIDSGRSTLRADGAILHDGALHIPSNAAIQIGTIDDGSFDNRDAGRWRSLRMRRASRRLGTPFGKKKVLVVRANAWDASTTANAITLSNNIFGTGGDPVNLKSQYDECSYGQLTFEPFDEGNGVIEVTLKANVAGRDRRDVEAMMTSAAIEQMGSLPDQFDHVMYCMPPGTGSWIAYAYVGAWLSIYNDDWCQQLSTQVHEVGHNMKLAHSGTYDDPYADRSGMMGFSYKLDDSPRQCFNPAKSYQLGWYNNCVIDWNPLAQGTWNGNVVGVVDYDANSNSQTCIIRIPRPTNGQDLYVGYNRKKGMNSEVMANGDQVTIIAKQAGYKGSVFVAGLHPSSTITKEIFYNFEHRGRNLVIEFSAYGSSIDEAFVAIYFEDCAYPSCCEGSMCNPRTPQPTNFPTIVPTKQPTQIPPVMSAPVAPPSISSIPPTKQPTQLAPVMSAPISPPSISSNYNEPDWLEVDRSPIISEMLPNPQRDEEEYVEIFNPLQTVINLGDYMLCIRNGRNRKTRCDRLDVFDLEPNAYFMLCRDSYYVAESRTCHQVGQKLKFKNRRRQFVSLERITNSGEQDTVPITVKVDDVKVPKPKRHPDLGYVRKGGSMDRYCHSCWTWSEPASTEIYRTTDDLGIEYANSGTLPPSE